MESIIFTQALHIETQRHSIAQREADEVPGRVFCGFHSHSNHSTIWRCLSESIVSVFVHHKNNNQHHHHHHHHHHHLIAVIIIIIIIIQHSLTTCYNMYLWINDKKTRSFPTHLGFRGMRQEHLKNCSTRNIYLQLIWTNKFDGDSNPTNAYKCMLQRQQLFFF